MGKRMEDTAGSEELLLVGNHLIMSKPTQGLKKSFSLVTHTKRDRHTLTTVS